MQTKMNKLALVSLVSLAAMWCAAQPTLADPPTPRPVPNLLGDVNGVVIKPTGEPVSNVRLMLVTSGGRMVQQADSGRTGDFKFSGVRPGKYWVYASYGPIEAKTRCGVRSGRTAEVTIVLAD